MQSRYESLKSFHRSVTSKAMNLAEENRLKRRRLGSGRKRKLDLEDEDFIVQCIEDKGEGAAH